MNMPQQAIDSPPVPGPAAGSQPATAVDGSPSAATTVQPRSASASPVVRRDAAASGDAPRAKPAGASISGAIRDGNRAPPALRVCATPVDGGRPTCVETAAGARHYRIDVAPGRYHLLGWVRSGELALIAHALQVRCIRAPCPPDELIEVSVAAGEHAEGIDLNGGYVDIPDGWPPRPD